MPRYSKIPTYKIRNNNTFMCVCVCVYVKQNNLKNTRNSLKIRANLDVFSFLFSDALAFSQKLILISYA